MTFPTDPMVLPLDERELADAPEAPWWCWVSRATSSASDTAAFIRLRFAVRGSRAGDGHRVGGTGSSWKLPGMDAIGKPRS